MHPFSLHVPTCLDVAVDHALLVHALQGLKHPTRELHEVGTVLGGAVLDPAVHRAAGGGQGDGTSKQGQNSEAETDGFGVWYVVMLVLRLWTDECCIVFEIRVCIRSSSRYHSLLRFAPARIQT